MTRMLVAGVGNIFLSDDGFGTEVVRRMAGRPVPDGVELVDFGIRGVHLAYQLLDGYDTLVLIDAAQRGRTPGTVTLLEVDQAQLTDTTAATVDGKAPLVDAHGLEPGAILSMLGSIGGSVARVLIVACEPASVAEGIGLSPVVEAAIPAAIEAVERLTRTEQRTAEEAQR